MNTRHRSPRNVDRAAIGRPPRRRWVDRAVDERPAASNLGVLVACFILLATFLGTAVR